jgi:hypothetical protein
MKIFKRNLPRESRWGGPLQPRSWLPILVGALLTTASGGVGFAASVQTSPEIEGAEVQTRGPVHEAFAGVVTFNPQPGVLATKRPPDPIEEMPPDEKPEGENVTWIPGYWAWDDERDDYLWISGTWRALPPGRAWVAGYWGQSGQGYQWTSGYWVDAAQKEATYLPAPPATIEVGPNVPAPSPDYIWMPGCWVWAGPRYAWRPGYWAVGRADWDWVPPHYVWTPRGHIFVGGFWDYPVERRGVLFAPVFFAPHVYVRPHFFYAPSIVIDLGVFTDHLFCRPRYHHYYFGDYYAPAYARGGIYASFSFHLGHHGYDPIYSHHRWQHRNERDWDRRLEVSYRNRRDHEDARPPRTWTQQRNVIVNNTRIENRVVVANTFDQYRRRGGDNQVRYQPVAQDERERLVQRNREVQTSREQRRTIEVNSPATERARADATPLTAQVPRSSIVAPPVREPRLAPPEVQRAPRPDPTVQPRQEAPQAQQNPRNRGQQNRERDRSAPQASQSVPTRNPTPTPTPAPAPAPSVQPRSAPTTPQRERSVPTRPEPQPQNSAPVVPTPQPQPQRQPQPQPQRQQPSQPVQPRVAPSAPPREQRAPVTQPERSVPTRSAPERPAQVAPPQSQRNANPRAAEVRRNQSNPGNGKKGAEQLRDHGNRDRDK